MTEHTQKSFELVARLCLLASWLASGMEDSRRLWKKQAKAFLCHTATQNNQHNQRSGEGGGGGADDNRATIQHGVRATVHGMGACVYVLKEENSQGNSLRTKISASEDLATLDKTFS
jgi:hypothetical protein